MALNDVVQQFMDRPLSHKVAAWVLTLAMVGGGCYQYLYAAQATDLADLEEKRASLNTQIMTERRLAKNLTRYQGEVKDLEVKLRYALQELPDKKEISDLLSSISGLARDAGLEVHLFRPIPEVTRDFYSEVPVAVSVEGTFHQVATFFDEVGRLPRIVNINEIAVRNPSVGKDFVRVTADCTATTFRYLDEAERARAQEPQSDKRRRR